MLHTQIEGEVAELKKNGVRSIFLSSKLTELKNAISASFNCLRLIRYNGFFNLFIVIYLLYHFSIRFRLIWETV